MNILTIDDLKKIHSAIKWDQFWSNFKFWNLNAGWYSPDAGLIAEHSRLVNLIRKEDYVRRLRDCIQNNKVSIEFKNLVIGSDDRVKFFKPTDIERETSFYFKSNPRLLNKMPESIKNKVLLLSL